MSSNLQVNCYEFATGCAKYILSGEYREPKKGWETLGSGVIETKTGLDCAEADNTCYGDAPCSILEVNRKLFTAKALLLRYPVTITKNASDHRLLLT